jgi:hypothetical protein
MRHLNFLHFLLLITLCSCDFCREKDWTELPPETQTGANTFGCYVNGELFVKNKNMHWGEYTGSQYQKKKQLCLLTAYDSRIGYIYIEVYNLQINIPYKIAFVYYIPNDEYRDCPNLGGKEIGEITFTKFDTVNCIVSGRFNFPALCADSFFETQGDTIFNITDGRFDLKLKIYE